MTTTPPAPASPSFGRFLRAPWPGRWLKALVALVVLGAVALLAAIVLITPQLPELNTLTHYQPKQPLRVFTADGVQIGGFGSERRVYQPIAQTPKLMKDSLLAVEDARFYEHGGIDPIGVARAAVSVLSGGLLRRVQGGSSITQQVARTFLLTRERTLTRKLKEALLSLRIESALSKDQILELYMNQIYLGQRAYGFGAAAQVYFGKPVAAVSLAEAAMLAGLPQNPIWANPVVNAERARRRQLLVLGRMKSIGRITAAEHDQAVAEKLVLRSSRGNSQQITARQALDDQP